MQSDPVKEKLLYICEQFQIQEEILINRWIPEILRPVYIGMCHIVRRYGLA